MQILGGVILGGDMDTHKLYHPLPKSTHEKNYINRERGERCQDLEKADNAPN